METQQKRQTEKLNIMKTKILILIVLSLGLILPIQAQQPNLKSLLGGKKNVKLPASYQFEWKYKVNITTKGNQKLDMTYLIKPNANYFGVQMESKEAKQMDFMCIVADMNLNSFTMFMESAGRKMAMPQGIPKDFGKKAKDPNYTYKEIGTKEILGYKCFGMQIEDDDYIATIYYTIEAPISFKQLFHYSKDAAPKGFDPALIEVLKDEALVMEMNAEHKKKKKESFTLNAVSLKKETTSINTKEYGSIGF